MSAELKPCPFCGVVRGNHKDDCFLTLLRRVSRNTPTRITGNVSQSELDAAWNRRAAVEMSDEDIITIRRATWTTDTEAWSSAVAFARAIIAAQRGR